VRCVVVDDGVTVVSRVVVDVVVVTGSSWAQEFKKAATKSEKHGIRSFFIV
jgi:hypothetical protein